MQKTGLALTITLLMILSPMLNFADFSTEEELIEEEIPMETAGRQSQFDCSDYNSQGGPEWQNNAVLQGQIYEYPAGSGTYWMAEDDSTWPAGNELAPGSDPDIWKLSCTCNEIWVAGSQPNWDAQTTYAEYDLIQHNSGPEIWISQANSNLNNEPGQSNEWKTCDQDCSDFGGFAGWQWYSGMSVNDGDIVEWPAMSGLYWIADNSASSSTQPPGLYTGSIWKMGCTCAEIVADAPGGPGAAIWDSSDSYSMLQVVSHNGVYWISYMPSVNSNTNNQPGVTGWVWEMCGATCGAADGWGGLGGPDWDSTLTYGANSTVMYPPGSGIFYHVPIGGTSVSVSTVPADANGVANQGWVGPCTCGEIWFQGQANPTWDYGPSPGQSQFVWDQGTSYPEWLLVMDSQGTIWISLIPNNQGNVPSTTSTAWTLCEASCATNGGVVGAPYDSANLYSEGDIAEYPANSGLFYTFASAGAVNQLAGPPVTPVGQNPKWTGPCDCEEIWTQSGMEFWDSQTVYSEWQLVKDGFHIYYSTVTANVGNQPHLSAEWERCGFTCQKLNGMTGPVWDANSNVQISSIFEYPAHSGLFYMSLATVGTNAPAPGTDPSVWEGGCRCGNIGDQSTPWVAANVYEKYELVWSNAGSSPGYYISLIPNNVGNNPPVSQDTWRRCGWWCVDGNTGTNFDGHAGPLFAPGMTVSYGEIYEYPAYSGQFYMVWAQGLTTPLGVNDVPGTNPDIWSPPCDCEMIWSSPHNSLNSPMYDPTTVYDEWQIVGVSSSMSGPVDLWVSEINNNLGNTPSATSLAWDMCGEYCDGFDGYGGPVYVSGQTVTPGDVFEHPAGSGVFYMVTAAGTVQNSPEPGTTPDIWSDPCDCTSIWQDGVDPPTLPPAYGSATSYTQWQIVEHNGYLWLAMNNGPLSVPSPLNPQWKMCGDDVSPCVYGAELDNAWPTWTNPQWPVWTSGYSMGDQVSHGNAFYISVVNGNMLEPSDASVAMGRWIECDCDDLLVDSTLSYDPSATYDQGDAIYQQGALWFATDDGTLAVPGSGTTDWRPCNWCDMTDSNIQAWSSSIGGYANYHIGDTVAHNGVYYVSISDDNRKEPGVNQIWFGTWFTFPNFYTETWVECDCAEIAQDYLPGFTYSQGDVVVGPDGQVWISMYNGNQWWPGIYIPWWGGITISTWELCNPGTCQDPTVWTAPPGQVSGYQVGDAVTHLGYTWFLQPGNAGTAVPPDTSMINSPGPWQLCTAIYWPPWLMSPTIDNTAGEMRSDDRSSEEDSQETTTRSTVTPRDMVNKAILIDSPWSGTGEDSPSIESTDGAFLRLDNGTYNWTTPMHPIGPVLSAPDNSNDLGTFVYRTDTELTQMSADDLNTLFEEGIWIVAPCDASYRLVGDSRGTMLCGMMQNNNETIKFENNSSKLLQVRPGMLCPTGAENCIDIVLEDITDIERENDAEDANRTETENRDEPDSEKNNIDITGSGDAADLAVVGGGALLSGLGLSSWLSRGGGGLTRGKN